MSLKIHILTLFPGYFKQLRQYSKIKKALALNVLSLSVYQLRDYALDRAKTVDDYAFGGIKGMVLKVEPIFQALQQFQTNNFYKILLVAAGDQLNQTKINDLLNLKKDIVLVCGHYDGVDERVSDYVDTKMSVGDFITCGGETPAAIFVDCLARLLPGVVNSSSYQTDSFYADGLVSNPVYTRPGTFKNVNVPDVLLSGDHKKIKAWQVQQTTKKTKKWLFEQQQYFNSCQASFQSFQNKIKNNSINMKINKKNPQCIMIRINHGEDIMNTLTTVAKKHSIGFAKISAIGVIVNPLLGYLKGDQYVTKKFIGNFELINLNGYIAYNKKSNEPHIHLHCSMSDEDFMARAGHLIKGEAGFGIEFFLTHTQIEKIYMHEVIGTLHYLDV